MNQSVEMKPDNLETLIAQAIEANSLVESAEFEERTARENLRNAKKIEVMAWNAVYDKLVEMKKENQGSDSFRESKLGDLLKDVKP